jgi:hypothetical protein
VSATSRCRSSRLSTHHCSTLSQRIFQQGHRGQHVFQRHRSAIQLRLFHLYRNGDTVLRLERCRDIRKSGGLFITSRVLTESCRGADHRMEALPLGHCHPPASTPAIHARRLSMDTRHQDVPGGRFHWLVRPYGSRSRFHRHLSQDQVARTS